MRWPPRCTLFPYTTLFRSDRLPRGAASISDLSTHIEDATERAWVWATLRFGDSQIRTGYLLDRKSTRLNSSHVANSYAVFCLKKKKKSDHEHGEDERFVAP